MIRLREVLKPVTYGLFFQGNNLIIRNTINESIVIEENINILVSKDVNVKIVDLINNGNISIESHANSSIDYQIIDTVNTTRHFKCGGDLVINQICLSNSIEKLDVITNSVNANVIVNVLAIANNYDQTFKQTIDHQFSETISNISNFGVALDFANIVFDTTGIIEKGMNKSKCTQLSKGIILDDTSSITSKPILLIDEYDCFANHGASIGKMSDDSLFYLMSRGLSKDEAFLLILEGIISPFISKIEDEKLKESINKKLVTLIRGEK